MQRFFGFLLFSIVLMAGLGQAAEKVDLQLCASNQGDYPWVLPDRPGLNQQLIERAARQAGVTVAFHSMPWWRCLFRLSEGRMDGAFNSSFIPERLRFARYPMREGVPDGGRRLMRSGYSLYYLKGSSPDWDGQTLRVHGKAGVPFGSFAITRRLQDLGVADIEQRLKHPTQLMHALLKGEIAVAALKSDEGRYLLASSRQYRNSIEQHPLPLQEKDFFLVFSREFMRQKSALAERVWAAIASERESSGYQMLLRDFH